MAATAFVESIRRANTVRPPPAGARALWNRSALIPWNRRLAQGLEPLAAAYERYSAWEMSPLYAECPSMVQHRDRTIALHIAVEYWRASAVTTPFQGVPSSLNAAAECKAILEAVLYEIETSQRTADIVLLPNGIVEVRFS